MSTQIRPKKSVLAIAAYEGGASKIEGVSSAVKLSSNENPYGFSEKVGEAFGKALHNLHRYPGSDHKALRGAIGEIHEIEPEQIICGAGSDEIISLLCIAFCGPRDEVLITEHGFLMYRIGALSVGATPVEVPERARTIDVDAVIAACTARTKLVFIANPSNPTGTMLPPDEVERLAEALPPRALLVLDGAYAEYTDDGDGGLALAQRRDNVFVTRTFSKIYGLGGLRVGWGYGPAKVIDALMRVRGPFNLSTPQQEVAEAAVRDQAWVAKCRTENARLRAWLSAALSEIGVPSDPSHANFILARFADEAEAEACNDFLLSQGLIVRRTASYKLPHCLRITIGDEASCRRVAHAITQFKAQK